MTEDSSIDFYAGKQIIQEKKRPDFSNRVFCMSSILTYLKALKPVMSKPVINK